MQSRLENRVPNTLARLVCTLLLALPWLSPWTYGPTPVVMQWLGTATLVTVWWLTSTWLRSSLQSLIQQVAIGWLVASTISALMGLLQYSQLTEPFGGLIQSADPGQAYANLRQRNQLATLLAIGLVSSVWLYAVVGLKWTALTCTTLIACADAATGSRTGFFQLLLLVGAAIWWRQGRLLAACALLAYFISAAMLPTLLGMDVWSYGILSRVNESAAPCSSRLTLWSNVLHLIAQKPLLGWGWGELDYAHFVVQYPGQRFCEILDNAHNLPLHLAVELGVPVSALVCGVIGVWVLRNAPWRELNPHRQMVWMVLAMIALHSMLEYPLWYGPFQMAVVLCLFVLWCVPRLSEVGPPLPRANSMLRGCALSAAVAFVAANLWVGWYYWRVSQLYLQVPDRAAVYRENTLEKVKDTWLFQDLAQFAELITTPLTKDNAKELNTIANHLLHFSPEPRVIEVVIESSAMLGQDDKALYYLQRFRAAFPQAYAQWISRSVSDKSP